MGQKVNPIGLRLGINRTWDSRWFARKEYANLLLDDLKLRRFLDPPPGSGRGCRGSSSSAPPGRAGSRCIRPVPG